MYVTLIIPRIFLIILTFRLLVVEFKTKQISTTCSQDTRRDTLWEHKTSKHQSPIFLSFGIIYVFGVEELVEGNQMIYHNGNLRKIHNRDVRSTEPEWQLRVGYKTRGSSRFLWRNLFLLVTNLGCKHNSLQDEHR